MSCDNLYRPRVHANLRSDFDMQTLIDSSKAYLFWCCCREPCNCLLNIRREAVRYYKFGKLKSSGHLLLSEFAISHTPSWLQTSFLPGHRCEEAVANRFLNGRDQESQKNRKVGWLWQIRKEGLDKRIKLEVLSEEITSRAKESWFWFSENSGIIKVFRGAQ